MTLYHRAGSTSEAVLYKMGGLCSFAGALFSTRITPVWSVKKCRWPVLPAGFCSAGIVGGVSKPLLCESLAWYRYKKPALAPHSSTGGMCAPPILLVVSPVAG